MMIRARMTRECWRVENEGCVKVCIGSEELGLREFRPIEEASPSSSTPTRKRQGRI
jgi:hypothetical protein